MTRSEDLTLTQIAREATYAGKYPELKQGPLYRGKSTREQEKTHRHLKLSVRLGKFYPISVEQTNPDLHCPYNYIE